ncbi:UvrD-helicase domain-containing protein [Salinicola halimionae]|uniref:UvrD-helicase domain-containing protein n=1 Tax=Salinicola halimionae TaxID=1949081 RepID=UPI000DA20437|nr:UvrD-helicase domain-containing protein [Salinicola halimionae]
MQWSPSLLARLLFVRPRWKLSLSGASWEVRWGDQRQQYAWENVAAVDIKRGWVWASCKITLYGSEGSSSVSLQGLTKQDAAKLGMTLSTSMHKRLHTLARAGAPELRAWLKDATEGFPGNRWIRHSDQVRICDRRDRIELPDTSMDMGRLGRHPAIPHMPNSEPIETLRRAFGPAIQQAVEARNQAFMEEELKREAAFFEEVESQPLTQEQAEAAVCFDDRVLLIAAAGSGKTSTMVARAGYAVRAGIAAPHEVLMLAFNSEAAKELGERTRSKLGPWVANADQIHTSTFHAFALKVIGEASGRKPTVPDWLANGQDEGVMVHILRSLCESDPDFKVRLDLFAAVFGSSIGSFDSQADRDNPAPVTTKADSAYLTHRGEPVKSQEERLIANWLAYHGISYRYERPYHRDTADSAHSQYTPDFFYPDASLYHEHLALDAQGNPPPHFTGYAEAVAWKRELHRNDGNRYIETTSAGLRSLEGLSIFKRDLEAHGLKPIPSLANLGEEAQLLDVPRMAKLFRTFLSHYKAQGHNLSVLRTVGRGADFAVRSDLFLDLFEDVLKAWQERLDREQAVDFDDMLNQAAELIEAGQWTPPYRVVAVDEWQDTSIARARIVRALGQADVRMVAIGDDSQSIYRFAGSDLRLMTDFTSLIGPATTRYLTQTFRCPQHLNDVAGAFVQKNPAQIAKVVRSHNPLPGTSIRCVAYPKTQEDTLEPLIGQLRAHAGHEGMNYTVYLLGRYRHDAPSNLRQLQQLGRPNLDVRFATMHQSKGLEADYVFLLRINRGAPRAPGFPARIKDDPLLDLVMPSLEKYPDAEERRLMYVALTRARRRVILLAHQYDPSPFVHELVSLGAGDLTSIDGKATGESCPRCQEGVMVPKHGKYGAFLGCSTYPNCRYTVQSN